MLKIERDVKEKRELINAIGGGQGSHNKEGKNVLPLSMDEIQGPHSEGETAKISHYAVPMV